MTKNRKNKKMLQVNQMKKKTIESLPNEMLRVILEKVEVQPLISARRVSKRWLCVIEDICEKKTSLVIMSRGYNNDHITLIADQFNGLADREFGEKCVTLVLKLRAPFSARLYEAPKQMFTSLVELFPRVANLAIEHDSCSSFTGSEHFLTLLEQWSPSLVNLSLPATHHQIVAHQMNKLASLKRLCFVKPASLDRAIIAQLEHCYLNTFDVPKLVPHLGPDCVSLIVGGWDISVRNITQMAQLNARLVNGLTHLKCGIGKDSQVLPNVCDHFGALQLLDIYFCQQHYFCPEKFVQLSQLSSLSLNSSQFVSIDLKSLARSGVKLSSIRTLSLLNFKPHEVKFSAKLFCRVLSSVVPNLQHLILKPLKENQYVRDDIARNLRFHFDHLLTYPFVPYK